MRAALILSLFAGCAAGAGDETPEPIPVGPSVGGEAPEPAEACVPLAGESAHLARGVQPDWPVTEHPGPCAIVFDAGNPANDETRRFRWNGRTLVGRRTEGAAGVFISEFDLDTEGRLTAIRTRREGESELLAEQRFERDACGKTMVWRYGESRIEYGYDAAGRLIEERRFQGEDLRTLATHEYAPFHGGSRYAHVGGSDVEMRWGRDARGRRRVRETWVNGELKARSSFVSDAQGREVAEHRWDGSGKLLLRTRWDGSNQIEERARRGERLLWTRRFDYGCWEAARAGAERDGSR